MVPGFVYFCGFIVWSNPFFIPYPYKWCVFRTLSFFYSLETFHLSGVPYYRSGGYSTGDHSVLDLRIWFSSSVRDGFPSWSLKKSVEFVSYLFSWSSFSVSVHSWYRPSITVCKSLLCSYVFTEREGSGPSRTGTPCPSSYLESQCPLRNPRI